MLAQPTTQMLWCPWCRDYWERPISCGPQPKSCPDHRDEAHRLANRKVAKQRRERERRAKKAAEERRARDRRRKRLERWQRTPFSTQDGETYRVPHIGCTATVQLPTGANGWTESPARVTVLGRIRRCGFTKDGLQAFTARWVLCQVEGEDKPRDIAIERFALVQRRVEAAE